MAWRPVQPMVGVVVTLPNGDEKMWRLGLPTTEEKFGVVLDSIMNVVWDEVVMAREIANAKGEAMIEKLKNWNATTGDVDEAVELYAIGLSVAAAYGAMAVPPPQWLGEKLKDVELEVKRRTRDDKVRRLKEAQLKLGALKTAEEKRGELRAEIERLTAELA